MRNQDLVAALAALAQATRLEIMRMVVERGPVGMRAGEIGERLKMPSATLAFHLNQLRHANLLTATRQSRLIIYAAKAPTMRDLIEYLTSHCRVTEMANSGVAHKFNVLFLCTNNSARSVMAECIANRLGSGRFQAFSAGSKPLGKIHPSALRVLKKAGYETRGLRSKSWDEFSQTDSQPLDFVFTLCDRANAEVCPSWPGQPIRAHWGIEDPVAVATSQTESAQEPFIEAYSAIEQRIRIFTALPIETLERFALQRWVTQIGNLDLAA
jgi:arsenate reductase